MKKFASALLALAFMVLLCSPAYADLGESQFNNWYVYCGIDGFRYTDYIADYDNYTSYEVNDTVEPGIKLWVHSFDNDRQEYLLVINDNRHDTKGYGFVFVSESQLNNYFLEKNEVVNKERGKKQSEAVKGTVTSDSGIVLRQGPSTMYQKITVIPHNAKVTYQYTYNYGGYNWGYTSYQGQQGWACIDYVKKDAAKTTTTTKKTTKKTTATTTTTTEKTEEKEPADDMDDISVFNAGGATQDSYSGSTGNQGNQGNPVNSGNSGNSGGTANVIIVCCVGAIILAAAAVVALIAMRKKNEQNDQNGYDA